MKQVVNYKKFDSQRRFGIELEIGDTVTKTKIKSVIKSLSSRPALVTNYQPSTENHYWHIKNDATCGPMGRSGPKGVEVASYVGQGVDDLLHIAEVAEQLSLVGCKTNDNCGLHIHAEATDLTKIQVGTILAHWMKLEKCLQYSLPIRRRDNPYCQQISSCFIIPKYLNSFHTPENFYCIFSPVDIGYYENKDRRVTLNLVNYVRACYYQSNVRKTLELRWPEGTLNSRDIKCWTRLFLNFIDSCKDRPFPPDFSESGLDETLIYLGLGHENKAFTIFSEDFHETKTWLLERFIEHSPKFKKEAKKILNLMWLPVKKYT